MKTKPESLLKGYSPNDIKALLQLYGVMMPTYNTSQTILTPKPFSVANAPQVAKRPGRPKKMPVAKYKYVFLFTNGTEKTHFLVNELGYEDEAYFFTDNITKQEVTYFSHALASVTMDKL